MKLSSLMITVALTGSSLVAQAQAPSDRCGYVFTTQTNGPLSMAVCNGDLAAVKSAIDADSSLANQTDAAGYAPLDVAFHTSTVYWNPGYNPEMIGYLLSKGADANQRFVGGTYAVADAAYFTRLDIVSLLVDAGANVNLADERGRTPIRNAAVCDFRLSGGDLAAVETIQYLLAHGADITVKTTDGRSVLQSVPTPCSFAPDLCKVENLPTATWPTGSCKETYLLVKKTLAGATR